MTNENQSFPHLTHFASLLEAQPGPIRALVQYCLALTMVEAGRAKLISTFPGDTGPIHTFETATGEHISLARPPLSDEHELDVKQLLRKILREEGL